MGVASRFRAGHRQQQILFLLAQGQTDRQIALSLGISVATVRTYLTRLYRDNGFHNRAEAVAGWLHWVAPIAAIGNPIGQKGADSDSLFEMATGSIATNPSRARSTSERQTGSSDRATARRLYP
jgi:DNA-binding CsgD family transcriptional regulator